jgi:hypothetical protein
MSESPAAPTRLDVPFPDAEALELAFAIGGCRLELRPGTGAAWVSGTYDDPSNALPWSLRREGGRVRIAQEVRLAGTLGLRHGAPRFALALGTARRYALAVEGGASDCQLDLGGLPLSRVTVRQGAGRFRCDFSAPNPADMDRLDVEAGAIALELLNLANASFSEMRLEGGAASYDLDFGGTLRRDASVRIAVGVSAVKLVVPSSTAARVVPESTLGALDVGDGYMKREGAFLTEAALAGKTPVLTVRVALSLGALRIATR